MNKHTLLKRATAAALLSATLAAPGVVGLTAGTANAIPPEGKCQVLEQVWTTAYYMAEEYLSEGNNAMYTHWVGIGDAAMSNFSKAGC